MSDAIKHECGIALIRLLKPYQYYIDKYGTPLYGLNKLYLLMEKQHNRGQDGAGVATIKLDVPPGTRYISRYRSTAPSAIKDIFGKINDKFAEAHRKNPERLKDAEWLKKHVAFSGELLLGHLRYGTYGGNSIEQCHPFLRQNNWITRNLVVAGNFNLTNVDELFGHLVELGQHPKEKADTVTVMEKIGHFLDREVERLFGVHKAKGHSNLEITDLIARDLDLQQILKDAGKKWVVVVTSERPQIQTAFNIPAEAIKELTPGCALIIKKDGTFAEKRVRTQKEKKSCSFERIYFSRGNDKDIYQERKNLGRQLTPTVLKAVDFDLKNSVFSFIPNTAEVAFYGLVEGLHHYLNTVKRHKILTMGPVADPELSEILNMQPRIEKIALKDAKLRTFITSDSQRNDMVSHVYDTTYGTVQQNDNLVVLDDSIVRGTTLKQSILRILDRLGPKKIIVVSSAPQIRYPDCYGIDMAKMGDFIAFQAAIELIRENNMEEILDEAYAKAKEENRKQSELPIYRRLAQCLSEQHRRLVFHGRLSDSGR